MTYSTVCRNVYFHANISNCLFILFVKLCFSFSSWLSIAIIVFMFFGKVLGNFRSHSVSYYHINECISNWWKSVRLVLIFLLLNLLLVIFDLMKRLVQVGTYFGRPTTSEGTIPESLKNPGDGRKCLKSLKKRLNVDAKHNHQHA